ncbi:hypothetical protein F2Q68_00039043 [Brassica cretica]|uniref:Uncharacterized protein n=1 Tax=Brassica cretica TaxID=69181 RepID=A0A8S9MLV3_BRACR|nr:hypothetical protein F2Q68_00039043 [Brassica cretica]
MGDYDNQEQLTAQLQQMQQQMLQMHQTIQAKQDAAQQAALAQQEQQAHAIQNQNQRQPQSNRQAIPATENSQPDELKGLGMMMQQLLHSMQIQGKALNQVSTDINTRMDNMFTEVNTKYDTVSDHIKRIDVQLAQTAESVKRQQELRCEKAEGKEPEQLSAETAPCAKERTEQPASSELTAPDEPIEIPPVRVYVPKVPYPIPPRH